MIKKNITKENIIFYGKLIRDGIPEIIQADGKKYFSRKIEGSELKDAIGYKILEETYELFEEWKKQDKDGILKESADLLEIVLSGLSQYGIGLEELLEKRMQRQRSRGGFEKGIFLESVGGEIESNRDALTKGPGLIFNPIEKNRLLDIIRSEFIKSDSVKIASAFYSPGVLNILIASFEQFINKGGRLKILLSTMGNITKPEYLSHLSRNVPGVEVKVFHPQGFSYDQAPPNFHPKIWLFQHQNQMGSMIIGSSNFTEAGFTRNVEWNYYSTGEVNLPFLPASPFQSGLEMFDHYWQKESVEITDEFLNGYRKRFNAAASPPKNWVQPGHVFDKVTDWGADDSVDDSVSPNVEANGAQKEAIKNLSDMRSHGIQKAAVIAATGIGKTFLSAFDFLQSGSGRLLFIAHRENILMQARQSYRSVLGNSHFGVLLSGSEKIDNMNNPGVFAMIQTLMKPEHHRQFVPDHFDYIVMDEFHHAQAAGYRAVLNYFKPKFFLGLTATPERMDGRDVLKLCDYNVAYELRLLDAVGKGWLTPFQYFAVYDKTDYEQIKWTGTRYDENALTAALNNAARIEIVAHNLQKYLPSWGKIKAIAFCSSIAHADYTARQLSEKHQIPAIALTGSHSNQERTVAIRRLQNEQDNLQIICTVDIFNEGIDIPELSHVLLLRPTQSFTVFLQQLGRGLRRAADKEYLVVIDFVGNFKKVHVAPLALAGYNSTEAFRNSSKETSLNFILKQLPDNCYLNPDIEVQRIWDREIKQLMAPATTEARLKSLYLEIKDNLGISDPSILDVMINTCDVDPFMFIRHFKGWLRVRKFCEENFSTYENELIDTPGESFLYYIETSLNPTKSYKMVVLSIILKLPGTIWSVKTIAEHFLNFFLENNDKRWDYKALYEAKDPLNFNLNSVISHLERMPLHFLSNYDKDYFILDKTANTFALKEEIRPYWENFFFRELTIDRVDFLLARYFSRKEPPSEALAAG